MQYNQAIRQFRRSRNEWQCRWEETRWRSSGKMRVDRAKGEEEFGFSWVEQSELKYNKNCSNYIQFDYE